MRIRTSGVAAPKLLDDDGTLQLSCRAFPGYATALFGRYSLLTRLFPDNRRSREYLLQTSTMRASATSTGRAARR